MAEMIPERFDALVIRGARVMAILAVMAYAIRWM